MGRGARPCAEPGRDGNRNERPADGRHPAAAPSSRVTAMTVGEASLRRPARTWAAAAVSAPVLGLAVIAGLRSSPTSTGPLIPLESLSAPFSGALLPASATAPLGF